MISNEYNYAEVLIDAYTDLENQTLTYSIPDYLKKHITLGTPVIVPLRESQIGGYVVELHQENFLDADIKVKSITSASANQILSEKYIELIKWIAEYYHTNFLSVLKTAIPSGILTKAHKEIEVDVSDEEFIDFIELQSNHDFIDFCMHLFNEKKVRSSTLKLKFGSKYNRFLKRLLEINYIKTNFIFQTKSKHKKHLGVTYLSSEGELSKRENEILSFLKKQNGYIRLQDVLEEMKTSTATLRKLESKACVDISEQIILRQPHKNLNYSKNQMLNLNEHQQKAFDTFLESQNTEKKHKTLLLHGVTGSGKTEVYIRAIDYILQEGKTSIVLVPEISLTPQTVERFRSRFGDCIAVLHSSLSEGERFDEWERIKSGLAKIIIGARSAIFAPCTEIGLIIIDEEHEGSYKQDKNPRYNAKTVALKRAEIENATVILGSATPSVESYFNSLTIPTWKLLEMPERVKNQILPPVELVDMRQEFLQGNKGIFSRQLKIAIEDRLNKKEQIILFINRRGFSTFVLCRDCGYTVKCNDCSVSMVYHSVNETLKCHYCGSVKPPPHRCPKCKGLNIRHFGIGTQKIETFAQKIFPTAKIARLDKDTTSRKDSHYEILSKFSSGEFDILIGTQMVAKGLDFPNVTLVGIITADTALNLPDFRAGERTFQLITQVAGRSGRGDTKGEVIAQAYSLDHISIQSASRHDFKTFYENEINDREDLSYPPFTSLVNIITANMSERKGKEDALKLGTFLKENKTQNIITVLGPVPAGIPKIKNFYRFQILIKTKSLEEVRVLLKQTFRNLKLHSDTKFGIDVDPINML